MKKFIVFLIMIFVVISATTFAEEIYLKGKVIKIEEEVTYPDEDEAETIQEIRTVKVRLLEGPKESQDIDIEFPIYKENAYNITIKDNDYVVLYYDTEETAANNNQEKYFIIDVDKRSYLFIMAGIFVAFAVLFSRSKGVKGLLALVLVVAFIYKFFIPYIISGNSPILGAVLTAIFSSVVTIYLMTGFNKKGIVATIGSIGGVVVAGVLSLVFVHKMRLTGYVTTEVLNYSSMLTNINLKEIISAGVIVGSMGAVMDVAMSISSSLTELKEKKHDIGQKEMFKSGMNIGGDMIGTMINTLILAYIGSSLMTNVLISLQREQYPMIRILNFESIVVDILRALCGSMGILIAVPLTAFIASKIYTETKKK